MPAAHVAFYADTFHGATWVDFEGRIFHRLPATQKGNGWVIAEHIEGMPARTPHGGEAANISVNHLLGAATRWVRGSPAFNTIEWGEILPGIYLSARMQGASVEKIFTLQPGADPADIRIRVEGARDPQVSRSRELVLQTPQGPVRFSRPKAWQERFGVREVVSVDYRIDGQVYGFKVGTYDHSRPLFIDPLLSSTYLGGSDLDPYTEVRGEVQTVRDPATGDIIVASTSRSTDFPVTAGALDVTAGATCKAFLARLDGTLGTLEAATWLGGTNDTCDTVNGLALDADGNIYLTGTANSQDFPTTAGAWDTAHSASYTDAYVAKLSPALDELLASTFLGGSVTTGGGSSEYASAIALDDSGNVFVAGTTAAADFPATVGAMDTAMGPWCQDGYLAKFTGDLSDLTAATYLGTAPADCIANSGTYLAIIDLAVDASGDVVVAGRTNAANYPVTAGSYQGGASDALIVKVAGNLATRQAAVYLGGNDQDVPKTMTQGAGGFYVAGTTYSTNFPATSGALQETAGGNEDGFVAHLDGNLGLVAATYLGGGSSDGVKDIAAIDGDLIAVVTGSGAPLTSWIPATAWRPFKPAYGNAGLLRLDAALASVKGGTWFGGSGVEILRLLPGGDSDVYLTGSAEGSAPELDITSSASDTTSDASWRDLFIARLSADLAGTPDLSASPGALDFGALSVPASSWPELTIELANTGTGWLRLGALSVTGAQASSFVVDSSDCSGNGADLKPAGVLPAADRNCTVRVKFQPFTVTSGTYNATLQVPSNDPVQPVLGVPLTGTTVGATTGGGGGSGGGAGGGGTSAGGGGGAAGVWLLGALLLLVARKAYRRAPPA